MRLFALAARGRSWLADPAGTALWECAHRHGAHVIVTIFARQLPELREAIAEDSYARRRARATPEMVVVTPGGKPVMFYTILALIDPGDEVLYPNPGFPIYESMIRYIGGIPIPVRLLEDRAFALAPASAAEAREILSGLRIGKLLEGLRGKPPADVEALCRAVERLSVMALALGESLAEVDINPVIAGPDGCLAVDALVKQNAGEAGERSKQ